MIYLGREKATNQRIMVGSSDGRTYRNQSRFGVGVFDFKIAGRKATSSNEPGPTFVGYASIPGIENASAITEAGRSEEHEPIVVASPHPAHKSGKSKPHQTPKRSPRDQDEGDGSGER
jgi:hypothetical protein